MAFQKWKLSNQASSLGILSTLLTSCTLLFSEPDPQPPELDEDFNKEPYKISFLAQRDSMNVIITPPYWSSLNYCARSFCGYADTRGEYRDIGFVVALDDTFSVLWNNRSGDTLRTLVQIDRDWFTEGFVVAGDTLRIRRPKGAVGPFSVDIWGKIEPSWYHSHGEEGEILEVIASASGEWEEIKYVHLRSMGVKDTIASSPLQYVDEVLYLWND